MKKLMTSTIILLPLIILAILLVSGAIKALTTHIYVDRVEFVDDGTLVLVMDDEENPPAEQLEVNVLPLKAVNRDLVFSTDDESIATVDASGRVVAKYYGETYINVMSAEDNLKTDRRRVLVTDDAVHKIEITEDHPTDMYEANTEQLAAVIYPREAKEGGIKWTTSNPAILAVSETGIIEARGYGEATITATSVENEEIFDSVTIKCHSAIDEIGTESGVKRVETALETAQFPKITQSPLEADVTISYTSDDPDIAKVDENGQITFFKVGKVTITATATDFGNAQASTSVEYVSTLHYYRLPLFEKKMYTVDFDEYYDANRNTAIKPLEIPFAAGFEPENTNRKIKNVEYSISSKKVLEFDAATETFYFVGEMPDGTSDIRVTVTAEVYDTETNELTEKEDAFTLTVQRKAKSIAVGYNGTVNAQSIVLSDKILIFGTDGGATAPVSVFPSNHTDKLSYTLENAEGTATLSGGTLTFRKSGSVNVLVSCKYTESGEAHAESRITVSYAPATAAEHKKPVTVTPPQEEGQQPAKQQVLLSMGNDIKEEGILYFAEPAGTTVTYAVEDAANAAVELKVVDGVQHIVPKRGGFATITITVSPATVSPAPATIALFSAPRNGEPDGTTVYTAEVYVDQHVSAEDLSVQLNGKPATGALFGATGTSVSYEFIAADTNSAMAGKVLYVTYGGLTAPAFGEENSATASGIISFPENINSLAVTFGVKYSDKASGFGAKETLPTIVRTLKRNAESVTFRYRETDVSAITTTRNSLTFKTAEAANDTEVYVKIGPDNHTDTPEYSLVDKQDGASITSRGVLTFTDNKPCTVTVQIQLRGLDGEISDTYTIEVHYAPRSEGDTVITLPADDGNKFLLSMMDTAKIDYVVPAEAKVECTSQNGVVSVAEINGEWTIAPQKGGFDTVTFRVNDTAYTVYIYVDRTVANDFTVEMGGTEVASQYYSTAQDAVSFTVTVNCEKDAMVGKQIYVKYGSTTLTGEEGETAFAGNGEEIDFKGLATLPVTFGVQYAESANEYGRTGELGVSASRTVARNATDIIFSYKGTTVSDVTTTSSKLTFKTSKTAVAGEVYAEILPANHTDTVKYSLTGSNATIDAASGELKFTKANEPCTVTVQIQLVGMDGKNSVSNEIQVKYSPRGDRDRDVNLPDDDGTDLLLFMSGTSMDKGKINYTKPEGAEVVYKEDGSGVVQVTEEGNAWTIIPKKGGFATVTVTVTGENLNEEYTVNVYVNRAVTADNFDVTLRDTTPAEGVYGTTAAAVSFEVTVNCQEGAMEGKQICVKYNGQTKATGVKNSNTLSGTIDFAGLGTLEVTFGVEYADDTSAYKPEESDDVALSSVTRTLARNAESITVTYGKVATAKIVTKEASVDFNGTVTVAPANHTDTTLAYVLEGGAGIATIDGSKLTFQQAGTVTVKVQTKRGDTVTLTKSITVTYEALGANQELRLGAQTETKNVVMSLGKDALIYYTVPENATVAYEVSEGGVIGGGYKHGADAASGVYHITPQKGGFATVTVKVNGQSIDETHTFNIYVNAPVASDNIAVKFGGIDCAKNAVYGTTETAVSFEVTVNCEEGAMVGKQLYVEYNNGQSKRLTAIAGQTSFADTIEFSGELGSLTVTFGVEYASSAAAYSGDLKGIAFGATTTRELGRNAASIAVKYGSVETEKIVTYDSVINFQEDVQIIVEPQNHTDTFAYELEEGGNGIAEVAGSELKFTGSGTVTLIIKTVRNGAETCRKEITVTYEPLDGNIEIKLDKNEQSLVLPLTAGNQKEALIYYTVPKDATVSCTFAMRSGDSNVITAEFMNGADETSGVYHIVPKTGGFATVTVTVEGGGADATYTIKVYVDAPVTKDDFTVKFKAGNPYNVSNEPNGKFAEYTEEQEFTTCNEQFSYQIIVANNNGSMLGKQLCIEYTGKALETLKEKSCSKVAYIMCDKPQIYYFTISVKYTDDAVAYGATGQDSLARTTRTATSTMGALKTAPTVTYDGDGELNKNSATDILMANIGDEITFTVDKASYNPADFKFSGIQFNADDYVGFSSSDDTFTLTAKRNIEQARTYQLNIGEQVFDLNITVQSKAQEIRVTYAKDKTIIGDGQKYKTLVDSLTFTVKAGRLDGEPVTNSELEYDDGSGWKPFDDVNRSGDSLHGYEYTYTLSGLVSIGDERRVEFRTKDGSGRTFTLLVERAQLSDFSLEVRVSFSDGNPSPVVIGGTKSVRDAGGSMQVVLPARMSGTLALYIVADDIYLGGFGSDEQFAQVIPATLSDAQGWGIEHTLISVGNEILPHANINLTVPVGMSGSASVEIGGGDYCLPQCTIQFTASTSDIAWIEFPGFDGNNSADVYKGYQQVRVFAKKSDYGTGNLVDYYRIPVAAYQNVADMKVNEATGKRNPMTDLSGLNWKLTSYTDNAATEAVVVTQTGRQVTYNGTIYNIVGDAGTVTLQLPSADGAGTTIVNANGTYADGQPQVPWVDTVSEAAEGYVRVYFGAFTGLSESDVQNDYFGNFGEEEGWARPSEAEMYGVEGKKIEPSEGGAFSFLRLEGGDGSPSGINAHFNFNVLQDTNLVNVFNATGYYAHDSLVLHENLYGPGELAGNEALDQEAQTKDLYLNETDKAKVGKPASSKIYGNGYQLNFQARNNTCALTSGKENTGDGTTFGTFYNVTVKGCNPVTNILPKDVRMIYTFGGAYYSDIQYYSKMNPAGGKLCLKNTVLHCVANAAIQLWWSSGDSTQNVYFEDVVLAECLRGLSLEGNSAGQVGSLHIKGRFDVLNYTNAKGMQDRFNAINGGDLYSSNFTEEGIADQKVPGLIDLAPDLLEWFGKNGTTEKTNHRYYINMILTALTATTKIEVWDEKTNQYSENAELVAKYNLKPLAFEANGMGVTAYTYDVSNMIDGGKGGFENREMSELFTENRDIRLLCEYKTSIDTTLVKNDDHIKWHMNQVYRDVELAGEKEGHIENLKKTMVGVKWPDGTSAADAGVTAAIALNELLSETVIPSKSAY